MINILIVMGGKGQRFKNAGYAITKPLININGQPMIKRVINNLNIAGRFIFIISEEDEKQYNISNQLLEYTKGNQCVIIVENSSKRQGAASACLLAKPYINNSNQLLIANSDQLLEWSSDDFLQKMKDKNANGGILTFASDNTNNWGFVKLKENSDLVTEVAEKIPISHRASVGLFYFKYGRDFVKGAESMIRKDIRTNNEFYVAPVFNELISEGSKIYEYPVDKFISLGTPEELSKYLLSLS